MKNIPMSMKRIPLVILITALAIGLCLMLGTCNTNPQIVKPDKEATVKAHAKVSALDKEYHKANALLKSHSDSLQKELFLTQENLKAVKSSFKKSKQTLLALAQKDTAGIKISDQLIDCDSLKKQTILFAGIVDSVKDEYECNIIQLQELVAIKDSEIVICRSSYSNLKRLADENLERERKLTQDLQTAYKVQRRKVFQNKLLAGGMLILSGITTTLYINANK